MVLEQCEHLRLGDPVVAFREQGLYLVEGSAHSNSKIVFPFCFAAFGVTKRSATCLRRSTYETNNKIEKKTELLFFNQRYLRNVNEPLRYKKKMPRIN